MKKEIYYTYLGDKGTITSYIQIPGVYSIKKVMLFAEENKKLTKDNQKFYNSILIPESELPEWKEVDDIGQ